MRRKLALFGVLVAALVGPSAPAGADATVRLTQDVVHHLDAATLLGLNNLNFYTPPRVAATGKPSTTAQPVPSATNVPVTGLLSPKALWSIYDQPATNRGNGQSMAIFGWGTTPDTITHLRAYE